MVRLILIFKRRFYFIFFLMLFYSLMATNAHAEDQTKSFSESQIKVALVYKLIHFVELPSSNPLSLCVYKPKDEDISAFRQMPPQVESGNALKVKFIDQDSELLEPNNCHVVFCTATENGIARHLLSSMTKAGILTIGETNRFIKRLGMISLMRKGSAVKFEVNIHALKQANLNISSQILRIADKIHREDSNDSAL